MSQVKVDTISERTPANGVAVDGVTIKDSGITIPSGGTLTIDSGATITNNGTASGLGGLIPISETVTSSDAANIDIVFPSPTSYNNYKIEFENLNVATTNTYIIMEFSEDSGSSFITTSNYWNVMIGGTTTTHAALMREDITVQSNATYPVTLALELHNVNCEGASSVWWKTFGMFVAYANGLMYDVNALGRYAHNNAINALRIHSTSGDIKSGLRYKIYGVVDV